MPSRLTCAGGHVWQADGAAAPRVCPTCGRTALASPSDDNTLRVAIDATPVAGIDSRSFMTTEFGAGACPPEEAVPPPTSSKKKVVPRKEIPGYETLDILGHGGMGVVYKARDQSLNRVVALKMILAGAHASERQRVRFHLEAEAVASLQHPNIVQVYHIGEYEDCPFFSLEFVDGGSLDRKIKSGPMPSEEAAGLIETLARAMHVAHQRGIVHRDLKPANVLMTACGVPKIADFGLAKRLEESPGTQTGAILGTPSYMAPEQAGGRPSDVGPAADVYALGSMLYEMLASRPPFTGPTPMAIIQQLHFTEPTPPTKLNPRVPRDLETICLKCLQKDQFKRYGSAEALAEDLRRFRRHEPITARPVGRLERLAKWTRRQPALAALIVLGMVAVASITFGSLWYARRETHLKERAILNLRQAQRAVNEMLVKVGQKDLLYEPRMEATRLSLLQKAVTFYQQFLRENGNRPELRDEAAIAHKGLADVSRQLGDFPGARTNYEEALRHLEDLVRADPTAERRNLLAETQFGMGLLNLRDEHRPHEAEPAYSRALEIWQALFRAHPDNSDYEQWQAKTHNELAFLYAETQRLPRAEEEYVKALDLQRGLAARYPKHADYQVALAGTLNDLARLLRDQGKDLERVEDYFGDAVQLLENLYERHGDRSDYGHKLGAGYNNLGILLVQRRQFEAADRAYDQALRTLQAIVNDYPKIPTYRLELATTYRAKGALAYLTGRKDTARDWMQQELVTLNALESRFSSADQAAQNADLQYNLGYAHGNLGFYYKEKQQYDTARDHFRQAVVRLRTAWQTNEQSHRFREGLEQQLENLADAQASLKEAPEALQTARELIQVAGDDAKCLLYAACYSARCLKHWPDPAKAEESRKQAMAWLREALKLDPKTNLQETNLENLKGDSEFQELVAAQSGAHRPN